eukprot:Hpha_TRINITY_DN4950_c0_g1::TRINITY_DN4950_c0_g1_i1::g.51342::m.51342
MALWVPDQLRPQCVGCGSTFRWYRRRHHCRRCGEVYCNGCSDCRACVPPDWPTPVRVCNSCQCTPPTPTVDSIPPVVRRKTAKKCSQCGSRLQSFAKALPSKKRSTWHSEKAKCGWCGAEAVAADAAQLAWLGCPHCPIAACSICALHARVSSQPSRSRESAHATTAMWIEPQHQWKAPQSSAPDVGAEGKIGVEHGRTPTWMEQQHQRKPAQGSAPDMGLRGRIESTQSEHSFHSFRSFQSCVTPCSNVHDRPFSPQSPPDSIAPHVSSAPPTPSKAQSALRAKWL